jgi:peroxiredoxin
MMDTPLKPDAFVTTAPEGVKVKDSRIAKSAVAEEGSLAPDFTLGGGEQSFKLSDLRGDVVLICFWSPNQGIGSKQMLNVVGKAVTDFEPKGLRVLSVTNVEGALSDLTLEETRTKGLFPVMYDKNGTVIKAFGLRKPDDQVDSLPALFVIDRKGVVTKIFFQVPTRTEISEALESAGF